MMQRRDTKAVRALREVAGDGHLPALLRDLVQEKGVQGAAEALGVSKATVSYLLARCGIRRAQVYLLPGERLFIRRPDGTEAEVEVREGWD